MVSAEATLAAVSDAVLGVAIVVRGRRDRRRLPGRQGGCSTFDDNDEKVIGVLAHAGVALEHARLYETSPELGHAPAQLHRDLAEGYRWHHVGDLHLILP